MADEPKRRLTDEERVLNRARALLANKKARSWSHAIDLAAETLPRPTTDDRRKRDTPCPSS